MTNQILADVLDLVVILVFTLIGRYLIPYLKTRLSAEKMDNILKWAEKFVIMAENITDKESAGEEKRELVTKLIEDKATELKIPLTDEQIRALIETAYNTMEQNK